MTNKNWEELDFSDDFMFGKIMTIPYICKGVLERILGVEIDRIVYAKEQVSLNSDYGSKSVRLDVYIKDGKGTIYNIEMQSVNTDFLPSRSRYYQSNIDVNNLDIGTKYSELKRSFVIFICKFDLFGKGRHIYTFENICLEDKNIPLNDKATKIFLNTTGTMDDISDDLKAFLNYVHTGIPSENDFVKTIDQEVKYARINRDWRVEYMKMFADLQDAETRGETKKVIAQVRANHAEGYAPESYTSFLKLDIDYVNTIINHIVSHPDWDDEQVYLELIKPNPERFRFPQTKTPVI